MMHGQKNIKWYSLVYNFPLLYCRYLVFWFLRGVFKVFEYTSVVTVWVTSDILSPFKYYIVPIDGRLCPEHIATILNEGICV